MTRRKLLSSILGTSAVAAAYPCYVEPRCLEVSNHRVRLKRAPLAHPIRLLHLSDFHASIFVPMSMVDHAITLGLAQQPDLICVTGDFVSTNEGFDAGQYVETLRRLSAAAPTFAVLGNHDGGDWSRGYGGFAEHGAVERMLADSRIQLLHNRALPVRVRNQTLSLAGVGDLWSGDMEPEPAFSGIDTSHLIVLLSHNPDTKEMLARYPWDVMLSGHTHGGQVIVPFAGPCYAPVKDKRYVAGLKPWGARQIHVTRGVGTVGGVRFRCRPEVSLLAVG